MARIEFNIETGETLILPDVPGDGPQPVQVPQMVTMRQARRALLDAGLLESVQAAIDALPEPDKSRADIDWKYSNDVMRGNGFVTQLAPLLGLTSEQLDALFIAASAYTP